MSRVALDTTPMVWRLTLRTSEGERPVEVVMSLASIEDGVWTGEIRFEGYPARITTFPVIGCDWIQAHQVMGLQVKQFLGAHAKAGPLYWRGTDVLFEVPEWRERRRLRDRLRAWWLMRRRGGR